jgi:hypothetical protein
MVQIGAVRINKRAKKLKSGIKDRFESIYLMAHNK